MYPSKFRHKLVNADCRIIFQNLVKKSALQRVLDVPSHDQPAGDALSSRYHRRFHNFLCPSIKIHRVLAPTYIIPRHNQHHSAPGTIYSFLLLLLFRNIVQSVWCPITMSKYRLVNCLVFQINLNVIGAECTLFIYGSHKDKLLFSNLH